MDQAYIESVRLLLESAPPLFEPPFFAMKGGTAINLFFEAMPRLSIDIDVVYADHQATRDEALQSISRGLGATRNRLIDASMSVVFSGAADSPRMSSSASFATSPATTVRSMKSCSREMRTCRRPLKTSSLV